MADDPTEEPSGARPSRDSNPLTRLLAPFGLVVLTRERVQEIFDEAVDRGRMTSSDAQQLVAEIVRRSVKQTDEVLSDIEERLARSRSATAPLEEYDDLSAAQVVDRLEGLTKAELRRVREHERKNANRKTVLVAVDKALAE